MNKDNKNNKKSHWEKSLKEAGLLDQIDDGWNLPRDPENEPIIVNFQNRISQEPPPKKSETANQKNENHVHIPDSVHHEDPTKPVPQHEAEESFASLNASDDDDLEFDAFQTQEEESENPTIPFAIPVPTIPPTPNEARTLEKEFFKNKEIPSLPHSLRKAATSSRPPTSDPRATANLFHDAVFQLQEAKRQRPQTDVNLHDRNHKDTQPPTTDKDNPFIETDTRDAIPYQMTSMSEDNAARKAFATQPPERNTPRLPYNPPQKDTLPPIKYSKGAYSATLPEIVTEEKVPSPKDEMEKKFELGDYTGALKIADEVLAGSPNDKDAKHVRSVSQDVLLQMFESRIGSMDRYPRQTILKEEIIWKNLDPMSSFVLSQIDGSLSFEDLMDVSGMPRFETCKILSKLLQDGIIE